MFAQLRSATLEPFAMPTEPKIEVYERRDPSGYICRDTVIIPPMPKRTERFLGWLKRKILWVVGFIACVTWAIISNYTDICAFWKDVFSLAK